MEISDATSSTKQTAADAPARTSVAGNLVSRVERFALESMPGEARADSPLEGHPRALGPPPMDPHIDPVELLSQFLRKLEGRTDALSLARFKSICERVSCPLQNLPGMPPGFSYDYVQASVDPKSTSSVANFVLSQARSLLLRCRVALALNGVQQYVNYPSSVIVKSMQQSFSWIGLVPQIKAESFALDLLPVFWALKDDSLFRKHFREFESYPEFCQAMQLLSPTAIFAYLFPTLDPIPPSAPQLPASLLTYYNQEGDFSYLVEYLTTWITMCGLFRSPELSSKPPLLKACLLALLPNCRPFLFGKEEAAEFQFHLLFEQGHFGDLFPRLFSLATQVVMDNPTPSEKNVENLGQPLVFNLTASPPVIISLLLVVVELLEECPKIDDPDHLRDVLLFLWELDVRIEGLPLPVRERATPGISRLLVSANAHFETEFPAEWRAFKESRAFDENLRANSFSIPLQACADFNFGFKPLKAIVAATSDLPTPKSIRSFTLNLEILLEELTKEILTNPHVWKFFALVEVPVPGQEEGNFELVVKDAPDEETLDEDHLTYVIKTLTTDENAGRVLGNENFRAALRASATKSLESL